MDETRRFLRYLIPGLVFVLEFFFYLWLFIGKQFPELVTQLDMHKVAVPIYVFLASSGIGFLLAVFYNGIIDLPVVDHRPLIDDVVGRGWLELQYRRDGTKANVEDLTRAGAWRIVTSFWHERKESCPKIKGANQRIDSLADIMHGSGTLSVGSILAILVAILIVSCDHYEFVGELTCHLLLIISAPLLIFFTHLNCFRRVIKDFQSIVDIIMADVIYEEFAKKGSPIFINVAPIDLRKMTNKK